MLNDFLTNRCPAPILILIALLVMFPPPGPAFAQVKDTWTREQVVEALSHEDGAVFEVDGRTYVWQDGRPYEVLPDGSRVVVTLPEEGGLYEVRDGRRWLSDKGSDIVYLRIYPKTWATIHFDYDSADIKEGSYPVLDAFGEALAGPLSESRLVVIGHTDAEGPDDYNLKLSRKRAMAVADYLLQRHDLAPQRIILEGYGESDPLVTNETEEGRAVNRRVEFILLN